MNEALLPAALPAPAARYAHAVLTTAPTRWLHTAGVVPVDADGSVPASVAEQARVIWRTIGTLLAEAGMDRTDVVSVTTYVLASRMQEGLGAAMAERDRFLDGHLAASTLVTVPALAQPAWSIEIQVVAAR